MADHAVEIEQGERFEFGENWVQFLAVLNDDRIEEAKKSLKEMLNVESLAGKKFLDIGSGSGLFSLAARMLGATVYSFDYDPQSVVCTKELKQRYFAEDKDWIIVRGSVLDTEYLSNLGQYDVVYSWGVLHHTGAMWEALDNVVPLVAKDGQLFIAIYNNQGRASKRWLTIKKFYNALPPSMRFLILIPCAIRLQLPTMIRDLLSGRPFLTWREYSKNRGMSPWRDIVDWVGGYPFEVAKPEEIFSFYRDKGFYLQQLKTCAGGLGCNQFVFINKKLTN